MLRAPLALAALCAAPLCAQELPPSGIAGWDLVYATAPGNTSQLYAVNLAKSSGALAVGPSVNAVPSRWAHRRRTLGGLETAIALADQQVFLTPMGSAVGNGAIHMVDLRAGLATALVPTGNPAAYDLAVVESLDFVFAAEDNGAGGTVLRGFSYASSGALQPLVPAALLLPGSPAAYVNRIGVDAANQRLYVPTATGIQLVQLNATGIQMVGGPFVTSFLSAPTTNPVRIETGGGTVWVVGTAQFDAAGQPIAAGYLAVDDAGFVGSEGFGFVPLTPPKQWVPAVGCEELAAVFDGTDAYVYYPLREPGPGTFFVKPSVIGVVRFLGAAAPEIGTIPLPATVGEPFSNPAVHGARVAFESAFGPPFSGSPPGGGEKLSILYSPLDALGAASINGLLGVPAPLGGRVSTKGMDRPMWSRDGTRVMAATSHFAGAPNPGVPGLEVLDVPAQKALDQFSAPHTVVEITTFPHQSIVFPSVFEPRIPALAGALDGLSFYGNVFHDGMASILIAPFGELGQLQLDPLGFALPPGVVGFPAILPPAFLDATGSTAPIPASFGARRTSFNLHPGLGVAGLTLSMALGDKLRVQAAGFNAFAALSSAPELAPFAVALPAGSTTTTEILSF